MQYHYDIDNVILSTLEFELNEAGIPSPVAMYFRSGILDVEYPDPIDTSSKADLDTAVANHELVHLNDYRVWCYDCSKWFMVRAKTFPGTCDRCHGSEVSDATEEQFALRGYPVSINIGLRGYHLMQYTIPKRYQIFYGFVPFQNTPEVAPASISVSNVAMHLLNDLSVMEVNKYGFKYRVKATGRNSVGMVAFDWEAIHG